MADEDKNVSPAYVAYATFKNQVRGLAEHGPLPGRIDHSLLGSMSGSARAQFMGSLRFFDLMNKDGVPAVKLVQLAKANEAEWKGVMKGIVEATYPNQIKLLTTGTPQQLRESFVGIGPSIVTPVVRFLLAAAKDCGIPVTPHIANSAGGGLRVKRKKVTEAGAPAPNPQAEDEKEKNSSDTQKHTIYLDKEKSRQFTVTSPLDITRTEYERVCKWLEFTILIEE